MSDISNILNNCISYNIKTLKRRAIDYSNLPKEFAIVELRKQIQDNLSSFQTNVDIRRNVYAPDKVDLRIQGTTELAPIKTVTRVEAPVVVIPPPVFTLPKPIVIEPIQILPDFVFDFTGINFNIGLNAMGLDNLSNLNFANVTPIPVVDQLPTPVFESFGGSSGGSIGGGGRISDFAREGGALDRNDFELQAF
jgi:hypothetical protein